ncbi:YfcC family protein [Brevibacillus laterosporus]|uniref:YfcC family protein n=1 Tax=Brevibacillus laterosporus TaxID=1465 RepID=UPI002E22321C|nr:AbgT family transporter [Brevibacillus laterosporus]MED1664062.1 AbgT family transporter [Brevibacillus laterosporus]MED1669390.1 AbgT family transporter [Brevibacillus laterosporus]MED1716845.1 AbgT family transporter [Brevibacillus laterosporus]
MNALFFKMKRRNKHPRELNVFVLLLGILLLATVLTYIVPAGEYARVEIDGRNVVNPTSFHFLPSKPVHPFDTLISIHKGMVETADIIFFVLMVGGTYGIITYSGAMEALVLTMARRLGNQEKWLVPLMMLFFGVCGSLMAMAEETLPYLALLIPLALALGFDVITGAAIVLVGAQIGFSTALINPFTIGVAQKIAELPLFSGMSFRIGLFVVLYIVSVTFVYRYAMKVKRDPSKGFFVENSFGKEMPRSYFTPIDLQASDKQKVVDHKVFLTKHKLVLLSFLLTLGTIAFGVIKQGWFISEIATIFLCLALVSGLICRMSGNEFVTCFIRGAADLLEGALIIGMARAILLVLTEGQVMDTILFYSAQAIQQIPSSLTATGMFILQCFLNVIVPSGSGQAALTMPIMTPLADLVGITRQTAVLAFQLGDGFTNIVTPTSGYFMAGLALAKIPWIRWFKWIMPLIGLQIMVGGIAIIVAQVIGYGPF